MSTEIRESVDDLIRDLGELRVAAYVAHADTLALRAIERAIWDATHAIGDVIRHPDSTDGLSAAQQALRRVAALIVASTAKLDLEQARSRRLMSVAAGLRMRAQAQARRETS